MASQNSQQHELLHRNDRESKNVGGRERRKERERRQAEREEIGRGEIGNGEVKFTIQYIPRNNQNTG